MLKYEKLVVGEMRTNCYWLWKEETKEVIIIDPGDEGVEIAQLINERQLKPKMIVATHSHRDHTGGINELKLIFEIPAYIENMETNLLIDWGIRIIKIPGHTKGSICLYAKNEGWLFSGDSVLPEVEDDGRHGDLREVKKLPEDTWVLPGHGEEFWLATYQTLQERKEN